MMPQTKPPPEDNSPRVNLLISVVFHSVIILALVYFAARQGLLGTGLKKISVQMVKERPPEKPKEPEKPKPEPPKVEPPKTEPPKVVQQPRLPEPKAEVPKAAAPPVIASAPPPVAPPAAEVPSFEFDGGKTVQTSSDPSALYDAFVESALRAKWRRPPGVVDDNYVVEVELAVSPGGALSDPVWKKKSGDGRWDDSVSQAIAATPSVNRAPPSGFPGRITVRFDVQESVEPLLSQ